MTPATPHRPNPTFLYSARLLNAYTQTYLKPEHSLGDINDGDIHQLSVLSILVVSQEGQDGDDPIRMNQNLQLITVI